MHCQTTLIFGCYFPLFNLVLRRQQLERISRQCLHCTSGLNVAKTVNEIDTAEMIIFLLKNLN